MVSGPSFPGLALGSGDRPLAPGPGLAFGARIDAETPDSIQVVFREKCREKVNERVCRAETGPRNWR